MRPHDEWNEDSDNYVDVPAIDNGTTYSPRLPIVSDKTDALARIKAHNFARAWRLHEKMRAGQVRADAPLLHSITRYILLPKQ